MSHLQRFTQLAEQTWPTIMMGSRVSPDTLLTSVAGGESHRFDTIRLEEGLAVMTSFLIDMEKYNCVKKHLRYTKTCPLYIKIGNEKKRSKHRRYCDILNTFPISHSFTTTEFLIMARRLLKTEMPKKDVGNFLSNISTTSFLSTKPIKNPGFGNDRVIYIKNADIAEAEMGKLTSSAIHKNRLSKISKQGPRIVNQIDINEESIIAIKKSTLKRMEELLIKQDQTISSLKKDKANLLDELNQLNTQYKIQVERARIKRATEPSVDLDMLEQNL